MTPRRTRVLHVVNNLNYGGMERVVAEVVRRMDASRFEGHVLALGYVGHFGEGLDEFATVHVGSPMPRWSMLHPGSLVTQLSQIAPDVVHMHSGVWYKTSRAASLAGVPYQVYTDHGRQSPDPWLNRTVDRLASRKTDVIVCVSEQLGVCLSRIVSDPSRVCVIPNGVDVDRYFPRKDDGVFRAELGLPEDVPIVGSVGRLEAVKGYEVLLSAFARLLATHNQQPKPVLVVVGDGSERPALESAASALGVGDSVRLIGWRSDIESVLRACTVFAMSSHSEGTSVSLLEAMSSGLCPVVTHVGGNPDVLGPDLQHRLVPAAEPQALAGALQSALADHQARERDSDFARNRIVEHFGLDSMVRRYEDLYARAPANAQHTCD